MRWVIWSIIIRFPSYDNRRSRRLRRHVSTLARTAWLLSAAFAVAGCAEVAGSTSEPPGAGTASSITKDGITWKFSETVPVGQLVTGDYYVVGPVTIIAISPAPTTRSPYMNGSVVNLPTSNGKSGFDSRLNDGSDESWWFDASLRAYPPITLKPGDTLVSSISPADVEVLDC